jgi:hypothetical protein
MEQILIMLNFSCKYSSNEWIVYIILFFLEAESSDSSEQQNSSVLATLAALAEATAPNTAQQSKITKIIHPSY